MQINECLFVGCLYREFLANGPSDAYFVWLHITCSITFTICVCQRLSLEIQFWFEDGTFFLSQQLFLHTKTRNHYSVQSFFKISSKVISLHGLIQNKMTNVDHFALYTHKEFLNNELKVFADKIYVENRSISSMSSVQLKFN